MNLLRAEIDHNFAGFAASWQADLQTAIAGLEKHRELFFASYCRIAALNAWRSRVLEGSISKGSLDFFDEALNDALASHVFARCGSWRIALSSLRGCMENCLCGLYYMDHPVELRQWEAGHHRPGFAEMHTYLEHHPDICVLKASPVTGLAFLKDEYSTLSRAVHASAAGFRMTLGPGRAQIWKPEAESLGAWQTRDRKTHCGLNLLLVCIFRKSLEGTRHSALRQSLAFVIPDSMRSRIRKETQVNIPAARHSP